MTETLKSPQEPAGTIPASVMHEPAARRWPDPGQVAQAARRWTDEGIALGRRGAEAAGPLAR